MSETSDVCISCGYDLAKLETGGLCPECATPIAASRQPPSLFAQPLPLLRRWLLGVRFRTLSLLLVIAFIRESIGSTRADPISSIPGVLWFASLLVLSLLSTLGGWSLLSPPEGPRTSSWLSSARSCARIMLACELLLVPSLALAELFADGRAQDLVWLAAAMTVHLTSILIAIICEPLASLCPSTGITAALRWTWTTGTALALILLFTVAMAMLSTRRGSEAGIILAALLLLCLLHLPARWWAWVGLHRSLALATRRGAAA